MFLPQCFERKCQLFMEVTPRGHEQGICNTRPVIYSFNATWQFFTGILSNHINKALLVFCDLRASTFLYLTVLLLR